MGHVMMTSALVVTLLTQIKVGADRALEATACDFLLLTAVAKDSSVLHVTFAIDAFGTAVHAGTYSIESLAMVAVVNLGALGLCLYGTAIVAATSTIKTSTVVAMLAVTFVLIDQGSD